MLSTELFHQKSRMEKSTVIFIDVTFLIVITFIQINHNFVGVSLSYKKVSY